VRVSIDRNWCLIFIGRFRSRYTRIGWFLYEWLLGRTLLIPDLKQGNYIPLLDPEKYVALPRETGAISEKRQRIINNLTGTPSYSPTIRRTETLRRFEEMLLDKRARDLVEKYPPEFLYRAAHYLYMKETRSSYAIEHITIEDQGRTARFVALLRQAGSLDCFNEATLINLQNAIVDQRYAARGFRDFQNYVGQSLTPTREIVHFVPPQPEDLPELMAGWMQTCRRLQKANVHPVVSAGVAGFGFVFLHPFDDGNGRLHRFLIHHVLAAAKFTPAEMIFPVSATMLRQMHRYDAALEAYSREIANHVRYRLDDAGEMEVTNETGRLYCYPDLTTQVEALFGFIEETIEKELRTELEYLAVFDSARARLRDVVDMPDRRLDLFIRLCIQGKGHLSKAKRATFGELNDEEYRSMEMIILDALSQLPRDGEDREE
ncbi:MAG: Fic family protein, partial [Bacteroidota bacterium]